MAKPTASRQPAAASPPGGQPAQAQAHRRAYSRRQARAQLKGEALRRREAAHVEALPVQHHHAAGIDIGSRSHWVCVGFTTDAASCLVREFPAHTAGLQAIEVRHSDHDAETEARYRQVAAEHGLAVSGGSDFHGDVGRRASTIGRVTISAADLAALEARRP